MLLEPKPVKTMELTEQQARSILHEYCDMPERDCYCDCRFAAGYRCKLRGLDEFTADEVFVAVRELAGG